MDESFIGISDVEQVYRDFKTNGVLIGAYIFVYAIGLFLVVRNVSKVYYKQSRENVKDYKKFFDLLTPLFPYIGLMLFFPVIISGLEWGLTQIEQGILNIVGVQPNVSYWDSLLQEDERITEGGVINSILDWDWVIGYFSVIAIKPMALLIDNYLFSIVIAGRYVWLILLEFQAPFAIISLMSKDTDEVFRKWIKEMYKCYLYIPGFMIANFFAEGIFQAFFDQGDYNMFVVLFLIGVKIYLYRFVAIKINNMI